MWKAATEPPSRRASRRRAAGWRGGAGGPTREDGTNEGPLLDPELQADRIRAVREAAMSARVPLVVNARTDAFAVRHWSPAERFTAAVRRANGYLAAGADCLFV